jgi:hypothetical protein
MALSAQPPDGFLEYLNQNDFSKIEKTAGLRI